MKKYRLASFVVVLGLSSPWSGSSVDAEELIGAKRVLEQVQQQVDQSPRGDAQSKAIQELPDEWEKLPPEQAAALWLKVLDGALSSGAHPHQGDQTLLTTVINSLPSPALWPEISRQIDAREVVGKDANRLRILFLRILGHRLTGNRDALKTDLDDAQKIVNATQKSGQGFFDRLFSSSFDHTDYVRQERKRNLQIIRSGFEPQSLLGQFRLELEEAEKQNGNFLNIPDLVRVAGRDAAAPLLEKALLLPNAILTLHSLQRGAKGKENETILLLRELARQNLAKLPHPIWDLCKSYDTTDLFEAFAKLEIPQSSGRRYDSDEASVWYVLGLIVQDRGDEVEKFLTDLKADGENTSAFASRFSSTVTYEILPQTERVADVQKFHQFFADILSEHPEFPLWDTFVSLAAQLGKSRQALDSVETALQGQGLENVTRQHLERVRADALLAADRIEDGIAVYAKLLDKSKSPHEAGADESRSGHQNFALKIAQIGILMGRQDWIQQGIDACEANFVQNESSEQHEDVSDSAGGQFIRLLSDLKQFARAEGLLRDQLLRQVASTPKQDQMRSPFHPSAREGTLILLLTTYHAAERWGDVIELLEQAPWWGKSDLNEWLNNHHYSGAGHHGAITKLPVPFLAANALARLDRKPEARKIAEAIVRVWPGFDAGWQLALELTGDDFPKLSEDVFSRDQFEERPLIWLARYQFDRGDVAAAEVTIRRAIAIDPSDGEQGKGDRMRAYAVLAEILRKKQDNQTAAVYEGAVKAIRLAERADDFYTAGMLSRGIKMYIESLTHFADAYCIQSRLAIQLANQGDLEGAARHYQRAFELMPDSFGRVESHCFGCEGAFRGNLAENVATRVFTKLLADQPKNAKVHYLMGYLRTSQGRNREAVESFRQATTLDPDYLNAWQSMISAAGQSDLLTAEQREEATFQLLRLDPFGRHGHADIANIRDLGRLWTFIRSQAGQRSLPPTAPLFPLAASAKELKSDTLGNQFEFVHSFSDSSDWQNTFGSHPELAAIVNLLQQFDQ